ncbi:MAG: hypothetical protein A3F10_03090 [Coxiella sp. RIFCSPHIGHO2_12_FULL_42_15]|nr:MAG: hypothetical protein A3F10_03090 [Coxiella sp. RIFCSPHIGHO2_12_FULL_42_15]
MSSRLLIPVIYHPTNVIVLDDKAPFLNIVRQMIDRHIPYITETNPKRVLNYLRSHTYRRDSMTQLLLRRNYDAAHDPSDNAESFYLDFSRVLALLQSPDFYKKVVIVFIDRQMPLKDGLELCREIRKEGLMTILVLFTGETTSDEVVDAFNKGDIDFYLPKQNLDRNKINTCITEGIWKFFIRISETLTGLMFHELMPLYDEQFFEVFDNIRQKYHVNAFYLLDLSCSFLLVNAKGEAKKLFVRNEDDFKDCYDIAKDSKAPDEVLQALRNRQQFPYTKGNMGYAKLVGDQWDDFLISMNKVPGRELYYAVIDRPDVEIFSFQKYFEEVWPQP